MSLRHHEIAETYRRILDPLTDEKLRVIGEVAGVGPGTRILDLASGKGEMLCRWAEWSGAGGIGVDISEVFVADARARAAELGVADRVSFERQDARTFPIQPAAFDVASCLGATWIGDGIAGTIAMLRPALAAGGTILIGEPFWHEPPPAEALEAFGFPPDDYVSLAATADRIAGAGMELVEMALADGDSWDRYEAAQWRAVADWLAVNPDDPDHAAMRAFLDTNRTTYLRWGRRYLGWGVFVMRPA